MSCESADSRSEVAHHSYEALAALSIDLTGVPAIHNGWTTHDINAFGNLSGIEIQELVDFPPLFATRDDRFEIYEYLRDKDKGLHGALPFAEQERIWLLDHMMGDIIRFGHPYEEEFLRSVDFYSTVTEDVMVEGVMRTLSGRDLLQKFWSWRREVGAYSGGDGLRQARLSLAGLVKVLKPELGLPPEYERLNPDN